MIDTINRVWDANRDTHGGREVLTEKLFPYFHGYRIAIYS